MHSRRTDITVGLFVVFAFAVLLGMTILIRGGYAVGAIDVKARFPTVTGLENGSPVLVSGIRSGRVTDISAQETKQGSPVVIVTMRINDDVPLYDNAVAHLIQQGFIGDKQIDIDPGTSDQPPVQDGDFITGVMPTDMGEIFTEAKNLLTDLRQVAANISDLTGDAERIENIDRTLASLAQTSEEIQNLFADNRESIETTLRNMEELSSQGSELASEVRSVVEDIQGQVNQLGEKAEGMIERLDSRTVSVVDNADNLLKTTRSELEQVSDSLQQASDSLNAVLTQAREGEGTIGLLLQNPEPFYDLRDSIAAIRSYLLRQEEKLYDTGLDYRTPSPPAASKPAPGDAR